MSRVRWAGALSLALGVAALAEATTFRVRFLTDPVGPRGFPFLAASLLVAAGIALATRRVGDLGGGPGAIDGGGAPEGVGEGSPPSVRLGRRLRAPRSFLLAAALFAYAFLIPWLGFVPATFLALWATALLFEGPPMRGMAAALAVSAGLWLLFERALGIYLPVGTVWGLGP